MPQMGSKGVAPTRHSVSRLRGSCCHGFRQNRAATSEVCTLPFWHATPEVARGRRPFTPCHLTANVLQAAAGNQELARRAAGRLRTHTATAPAKPASNHSVVIRGGVSCGFDEVGGTATFLGAGPATSQRFGRIWTYARQRDQGGRSVRSRRLPSRAPWPSATVGRGNGVVSKDASACGEP